MLSREKLIATDPEAFSQDHIMNREVAGQNLLDIKEVFDSAGIRFWMWFGTFLGIYRKGALIPWDGDTDLIIYVDSLPALVASERLFLEKDFKFSLGGVCRNHEHTDFYTIYPSPVDNTKWISGPLEVDASAFITPNSIKFLGQEWPIVNEPEKWLTYLYGHNWRTPIKDFGTPGIPHGAIGEVRDHTISANIGEDKVVITYYGYKIIDLKEHSGK